MGEKVSEGEKEEVTEGKDSTEGEKKKFNLSQIKTPKKIIQEIRSRSKSREKRKRKDGGEIEDENKEEEELLLQENKTDGAEGSDLINEAKNKVKGAMDNINLPQMPNITKPAFMKKKGKGGKKEEEEDKDCKDNDETHGNETKKVDESSEETKKKSDEGDSTGVTADVDAEKKEEENAEDENVSEKKTSLMDSLKGIRTP